MSRFSNPSTPAAADSSFYHPVDSWYQIEAPGEHPNTRAGVVQVIDATAIDSIVNTFNREADSAPNFAGMLIDIEHFKHDENKETRAYGWLMRLRNRGGILGGQIRWTGTGKQAVDNGDYRFFSTEYDTAEMEVVKNGKPKYLRPLRLDGLTLTNVPNNKGQRPITNRIQNRQPRTSQPDMNTVIEDSPPADSATARAMAQSMAATTGRPFDQCWNSIRSARPDLFGLETREALEAQRESEAAERANRLTTRNRASGLSAAGIGGRDTRTLTERYHGAQSYDGQDSVTIVNRESADTLEIHDLVADFQRENNLPSFCVAWDRAKVRHPEWFFTTV